MARLQSREELAISDQYLPMNAFKPGDVVIGWECERYLLTTEFNDEQWTAVALPGPADLRCGALVHLPMNGACRHAKKAVIDIES